MEMVEILNFAKTEILRQLDHEWKLEAINPNNRITQNRIKRWTEKLDFLNAEIRKIEAK